MLAEGRSSSLRGIPALLFSVALHATPIVLTGAIAFTASIASATPVTSAANIPNSGISPGGVDMATGELILVMRADLAVDGPMPIAFARYYASMLAREGFASGRMGPNWLGTYDWSLAALGPIVNVVTNRGQQIRFQQNEVGYVLVQPTDQAYRLAFVGGTYRFIDPLRRETFVFDGTSRLLTQIIDERGNTLSLNYSGTLLMQVSDGLGRVLNLGYNPSGFLTSVSDGTRTVGFGYTAGILTSATDVGSHTWAYVYSQPGPIQGLLTGVTEPIGNTQLTHTYDPLGRVAIQTDAAGGISNYAFDAPSGNTFTDPLNHAWTYLHDSSSRLLSLTDPAAGVTSYGYDALGRLATMTRPMGQATSFAYDFTSGYPSQATFADGTSTSWIYRSHSVGSSTFFDLGSANYADGTHETYGRDAAGNLSAFTDRGGFLWAGTFNSHGQLLTATNPTSGVTTLTYDAQGRPATGTDNAGNLTTYGYDALSRLTQVTHPDNSTLLFSYDALAHLTGITDELGKSWTYGYDANGRPASGTDPLLHATQLNYDGLDRVTQEIDPLGNATTYGYDPAGRVASMTDRTGRMTSYQYDGLSRLTSLADPGGNATTFAYDPNSRVLTRQDPLGHTTMYAYDAMDRPIHVTDPVGTGLDYGYDTMGRLTSSAGPTIGAPETYGYDPRGLLNLAHKFTVEIDYAHTPLGEVSQLTDPNHNVWPSVYDPQGRMTSSADPLGRTTTYDYDSRSRPIHIGRPDGTVMPITYATAGSPIQVVGPFDGDASNTKCSFTYDGARRLVSATGASFSYDAAGRMTNSNGFVMTYDNEGRVLSETYAPGKVVSYAYDTRGLLSQVTDWMGGTTSFAYDAAGRLSTMSRPPPTGIVTTYQYDAADRLISSVEKSPGPPSTPLSSITLSRDALGQPTSINRRQPLMPGITSPSTTGFTYDAASQTNGLSWDPLGRFLSDGSRTFEWDGFSRLKHYAAGADSPRFTYDAFGHMLTRTQGNQAIQLGWNYGGHGYPTNDDLQVTLPTPKTSYNIHAPTGLLIYSIDGSTGARTYYHYDEAGNTIFLTNDAGSVTTEYAYAPFGGVAAIGQTGDNRFTYGGAVGMMSLGSSGLFSAGSETYDALTRRLISGSTTKSGPGNASGNYPGNASSSYSGNYAGNYPGNYSGHYSGNYSGHYTGNTSGDGVTTNPGPSQSPGDWVTSNPGPIQSPGDWVTVQPGPQQSPGNWVTKQPGPTQSPGDWVTKQPGPAQSPGNWVTAQPGPIQSTGNWVTTQPGPIQSTGNDPEVVVDKHGRVMERFSWDRDSKKDPSSSAWISGRRKTSRFALDFDPYESGYQPKRPEAAMLFPGGLSGVVDPPAEGPEESIEFVYGKLRVRYTPYVPSTTGAIISANAYPTCMWCVQ